MKPASLAILAVSGASVLMFWDCVPPRHMSGAGEPTIAVPAKQVGAALVSAPQKVVGTEENPPQWTDGIDVALQSSEWDLATEITRRAETLEENEALQLLALSRSNPPTNRQWFARQLVSRVTDPRLASVLAKELNDSDLQSEHAKVLVAGLLSIGGVPALRALGDRLESVRPSDQFGAVCDLLEIVDQMQEAAVLAEATRPQRGDEESGDTSDPFPRSAPSPLPGYVLPVDETYTHKPAW